MPNKKQRAANLHSLTARLIISTGIALVTIVSFFGLTLLFGQKLLISWIVFLAGIIGGFVSIQQRVKTISDEDLELLAGSWFQVLLIPIFGAIFSLILYCLFLSGIITGALFPAFNYPDIPKEAADGEAFQKVLSQTYPASLPDLAKLIVWSFAAGFAERLVPQILSRLTNRAIEATPEPDPSASPVRGDCEPAQDETDQTDAADDGTASPEQRRTNE